MSEPWEDFKSGGTATVEGPWTEFKKSEGPWSDFPKRPIQPLNPTPEPSLLSQAVEGFRRGFSMGGPLRRLQQSISVEKYLPSLPKFFQPDPGEGGPIPQTRTAQMTSEAEQNIARPLLVPGLPPGTTIAALPQSSMVRPPLSVRQPDATTEEILKTVAAPLAVGEEVLPFAAGAGPLNDLLKVYPWLAKVAAMDMASKVVPSVQQRFTEAGAAGGGTGELTKAILGSAVDVSAPIGLGAISEPRVARTGALPTEYVQGSPDLPFVMKDRRFNMPAIPKPPLQLPERGTGSERFISSPSGEVLDKQKLAEVVATKLREQLYQSGRKAETPLIGSRPLSIEQRVLSPAEVRMTSGTSEVTSTIPSAPKPEPLAGQVSFGGEGIPSAMQAKEMVPGNVVKGREQLSGTKMFSGVPLPGDLERYQELTEDALRSIRAGTLPSKESLAEIEQIKNQYGGLPPRASAEGVQKLRPAVKIGDKVYIGEQGATHASILKANGFDPKVYTHFNEARGFVSIDKPGEFLNRQQAQQISGIPGTAKAGGLDSQDLPGATRRTFSIDDRPFHLSQEIMDIDNQIALKFKNGTYLHSPTEKLHGSLVTAMDALKLSPDDITSSGFIQRGRFISTGDLSENLEDAIPEIKSGSLEPGNWRSKIGIDPNDPNWRIEKNAPHKIIEKGPQNALRELRTDSISQTQPSEDIPKMEEKVRGGTDAKGESQKEGGQEIRFGSGIPFRFTESKVKGGEKSPNIFWMQATGHLIPEDASYKVARDVVHGEETPSEVTDEGARTLEQDMRQKGFAKVVKYGDSIFVDQNASSTQLAGLQNLAKAEGKKLYTNVNLYSGLPILDPQNWRRISDKFRFGTAPVHVGADEHVANRMIEYAAADITADVAGLGQSYKDNVRKAWIDAGVNAGIYARAKQAPVIGGQHYVRIPELGNVYVRPDLVHEVEQVVKRRGEVQQGVHQMFLDLATEAQLIGPTDFAFHTANMFSSVVKSPGKSGNYILDQVLRQQGVKHLDALARIGKNFFDVVYKDPSIQAELTKISALGALRPVESGRGVVAKLTGGIIDTGKWIGLIDRAGRLARNKMFDNLVEQGLVRDNPTDRREFINQMGQYNNKLMSKNQEWMKRHFSQFVVAGRTFNKNAIQSAALLNEVRAASPQAYAKMKLSNLIAATATWIVVPVVVNSIITGKPFGRSGTPIGKIDTGKDDPNGRHIVYDPAKMDLSRRGARILGIEATVESIRQGDKPTDISAKAVRDIINGQLHPWEGPPVRVAEAYKQEYAKSGRSGQSLVEALKAINPTLTTYFGKEQPSLFNRSETEQKGGFGAVGTQLSGAIGYGLGRRLRHTEVVEEAGKQPIEQMTLAERLSAESEYKKRAEKLSPQQKAQGAGRAIQENTRRGQDLKKTLSKADVNWLDSREIPVQGFDNKLTIEGQRLYLTPKETDRLAEFMKEEYTKAISEARSTYDQLGEEERASYLKETFNFARDEARQRMVEELQKSSSVVESNRKRYKTPGLGQ